MAYRWKIRYKCRNCGGVFEEAVYPIEDGSGKSKNLPCPIHGEIYERLKQNEVAIHACDEKIDKHTLNKTLEIGVCDAVAIVKEEI